MASVSRIRPQRSYAVSEVLRRVPAVGTQFSTDDDWIELDAYTRDKAVSLGNLEQALTRYHKGYSRKEAGSKQDKFSAETLGYFVRQCVVVAGPGMGKTLLLRRIARLLARKGEPSLIVRLRPLAERMRAGVTFLEAALHIGLDASPFTPQDLRILGMQNLTLLLDGLDESGSEQDEIAKAASALAASYPRCRIVFTTRPIGYETAHLSTWRHYELASIESLDAKRSVERLVDAATDIENAKVKEATAAATSHMDYTRDYRFSASSPLLIALLASLALNEVIAAATREPVQRAAVEVCRCIENSLWKPADACAKFDVGFASSPSRKLEKTEPGQAGRTLLLRAQSARLAASHALALPNLRGEIDYLCGVPYRVVRWTAAEGKLPAVGQN